ncbi:MAG: NAD(P)H-hydrate dehydratase [Ilumatobacteraceae bacterium]
MRPVVTPEEMRSVDAAATAAGTPVDTLVERAGAAVARAAVRLMGGTYGRDVRVIVGPGNNGADGRVAGRLLREQGVRVVFVDALACPPSLDRCDLVIDAAFGTGARPGWVAPRVNGSPVLAVDVPSGLDALTGAADHGVLPATCTVTFQAVKPGMLMAPGSALCGEVEVADIGLGPEVEARAHARLVEVSDVARWWPRRPAGAHKWQAAVRVVAGSTGMTGAAALASAAAMRSGAGIVHLSAVGTMVAGAPVEVVQQPLAALGWADDVVSGLARFHSLVIGPGLGRVESTATDIGRVLARAAVPVVIDGDALTALAAGSGVGVLRSRPAPTVLTPHGGEYAALAGEAPSGDRAVAARRLASDSGAVVLLKGPVTVVADPTGQAWFIDSGDQRLATAGTGDVLAGMIGALLAQGLGPMEAAAGAAWVHGRAATVGAPVGLVASDLLGLVPRVIEEFL